MSHRVPPTAEAVSVRLGTRYPKDSSVTVNKYSRTVVFGVLPCEALSQGDAVTVHSGSARVWLPVTDAGRMVIECAGGLLASPRAVRSARRPEAYNQQYLIPARGVCLVAPSSPQGADQSTVVDSSGPGVAVGVSHYRTALDVSVR